MREKFVCARITRMNGVDLNRFHFDYDTTWNAFFTNDELDIYSRYGGRDEGEPEDRIGKESLLQTMNEVLAAHRRRETKSADDRLPLVQPVTGKSMRPEEIPLLRASHQGCVHCHQIREYRFLQEGRDGTFDRSKVFDFPLPEGVGLEFDRKHGHRVLRTLDGSAAEKAGVQTGDVVIGLADVPTRSEYDVRWALGRLKDDKPFRLIVERGNPAQTVELSLKPTGKWRETELGWRKSMRSLPINLGFSGYSLTKSQRGPIGLTIEDMAIRLTRTRDRGLAVSLGLKKGDVIVALAEQNKERWYEDFVSDLVRGYAPGDAVEMTVLREGKRVKLSGKFPKWHTEETTVP